MKIMMTSTAMAGEERRGHRLLEVAEEEEEAVAAIENETTTMSEKWKGTGHGIAT